MSSFVNQTRHVEGSDCCMRRDRRFCIILLLVIGFVVNRQLREYVLGQNILI